MEEDFWAQKNKHSSLVMSLSVRGKFENGTFYSLGNLGVIVNLFGSFQIQFNRLLGATFIFCNVKSSISK